MNIRNFVNLIDEWRKHMKYPKMGVSKMKACCLSVDEIYQNLGDSKDTVYKRVNIYGMFVHRLEGGVSEK